ncbi:hypothetical protein ACIOJ9_28930 [Streptomyces sp. NPDC088175]|uniref:hypothetical protein n=1 Tax=unclassified Streptomyces TaxID=2593676 RepID=UPI0037F78AA3
MTRIPDPADALAVVYESDGTRVVAFLAPALLDSPLRRALNARSATTAPQTPHHRPPGESR